MSRLLVHTTLCLSCFVTADYPHSSASTNHQLLAYSSFEINAVNLYFSVANERLEQNQLREDSSHEVEEGTIESDGIDSEEVSFD